MRFICLFICSLLLSFSASASDTQPHDKPFVISIDEKEHICYRHTLGVSTEVVSSQYACDDPDKGDPVLILVSNLTDGTQASCIIDETYTELRYRECGWDADALNEKGNTPGTGK